MPETREEQLQKTHEAAQRILAAIEGEPHARGLDALIAVYRALALKHTCCTQAAADFCMQLAMQLAFAAAQSRAAEVASDEQPTAPSTPSTLH